MEKEISINPLNISSHLIGDNSIGTVKAEVFFQFDDDAPAKLYDSTTGKFTIEMGPGDSHLKFSSGDKEFKLILKQR